MLAKFNIQKRTQILLSILGLVITLGFVLVSLGEAVWAQIMALTGAVFIGLFLWIEGGILSYINKSEYKSISFGDIMVWLSFAIGGLLMLQAVFLFGVVANQAPTWLLSFLSGSGITIGILAGLLFLYHLFTPTPR